MGTVVKAPKSAASMDAVGRLKEKGVKVVFVLGGPGSGKGTQCANIVRDFGFTHLSAGDLLRAEIKSGSENGTMIQNMIKEGKIVPSEVTIKLLEKAMLENGNDKFLIDGFPRNEENRAAFEEVTKIEPEFVLFFDCSEEEMERRLLSRNQGRDDDNIETIRKRFKVFLESSLPVIEYYNAKHKVRKVDAAKPIDEVFESVKAIFFSFNKKGSTIVDLPVIITPDPDYQFPPSAFPSPLPSYSEPASGAGAVVQKAEDVVSTMLAKGFILGKDALNKAKSLDEKHQFTSTATAKVSSLDKKIGLTETISIGTSAVNEKVKEMDQKFQVSEKTKSAFSAAEQKVSTAGSTIMKSRYVLTGASWATGLFNKVAKAATDVGSKAKEKVAAEEEQKSKSLEGEFSDIRLSDDAKAAPGVQSSKKPQPHRV